MNFRRFQGFEAGDLTPVIEPKSDSKVPRKLAAGRLGMSPVERISNTYRLEGEPNGVRKTFEMIIKTKGGLADDKFDSFGQIRLMQPEELLPTKKSASKR